jgi:hypothetical protein
MMAAQLALPQTCRPPFFMHKVRNPQPNEGMRHDFNRWPGAELCASKCQTAMTALWLWLWLRLRLSGRYFYSSAWQEGSRSEKPHLLGGMDMSKGDCTDDD